MISTCLSNRKKQFDLRTIIHTRIFTSEIPLVLILPIGIPYTKKSKDILCVTAGSWDIQHGRKDGGLISLL